MKICSIDPHIAEWYSVDELEKTPKTSNKLLHGRLHGTELATIRTTARPREPSVKMWSSWLFNLVTTAFTSSWCLRVYKYVIPFCAHFELIPFSIDTFFSSFCIVLQCSLLPPYLGNAQSPGGATWLYSHFFRRPPQQLIWTKKRN